MYNAKPKGRLEEKLEPHRAFEEAYWLESDRDGLTSLLAEPHRVSRRPVGLSHYQTGAV
jgi:hypothetical protein